MQGAWPFPIPFSRCLAMVAVVLVLHAWVLSSVRTAWRTGAAGAVVAPTSVSRALHTRSVPSPPALSPQEAPRLTQPVAPLVSRLNKPLVPVARTYSAIKNVVPIGPPSVAEQAGGPQLPPIAESPTAATPSPTAPDIDRSAPAEHKRAISTPPSASTPPPGPVQTLLLPASGSLAYIATVQRGAQLDTGPGLLEWTSDGRAYQMRLHFSTSASGLLNQTSVGLLGAQGLMPERFTDKRPKRSEKATHFNRDGAGAADQGRISFSGSPKEVSLQRGAQDRLSVLVQLAGMAAGNPLEFAAARTVSVQVATTEGADAWQFVMLGEAPLQLPAGSTRALHLVRHPRQEYDARLELWLAPELGYLPARIQQTEANGNTTDLQLRSPTLP
jgi:Protein of unknown function (DUF3108)